MRFSTFFLLCTTALIVLSGCGGGRPHVVLYCAQDREYAELILDQFSRETGITVEVRSDTEATKTVGLYEAIVRERQHPRCDVFWNNEIVNTLRLQQQGLLEPYASPSASPYPTWTRPIDFSWQAFAARARVLIVHRRVPAKERPTTLRSLTEPRWKGRLAMAKPHFGTTATHMACLWSKWGPRQAKEFLLRLQENVTILGGNKDVALAVAEGRFDVGITDTDDAQIEVMKGMPVDIILPDQDGDGTLFLPNTLMLIKGGPNPTHARRLMDYLLSPAVEARLADGPSSQIPLNPNVGTRSPIQRLGALRPMGVDFRSAAQHWEDVQNFLRANFAR